MQNWAKTSQAYIKDNQCGNEFKHLSCKKIYIWGDVDTPGPTEEFIKNQKIPNKLYKGVGHWHMVENAELFYNDVKEFIEYL